MSEKINCRAITLFALVAICCCYDGNSAKSQDREITNKSQNFGKDPKASTAGIETPIGCANEQCVQQAKADYSVAVVSALTLFVLILQWRTYVNQMKTSRAIERGWIEVVIVNPQVIDLKNDLGDAEICVPWVAVQLKNAGRTPAWITSRSFLFRKIEHDKALPASPTYDNVLKCIPPFPLNPGALWPIPSFAIPISGSVSKLDYIRICRKELQLVFGAEILYRDIFGKSHMTRVLAQWDEAGISSNKQFMWKEQKGYNAQT